MYNIIKLEVIIMKILIDSIELENLLIKKINLLVKKFMMVLMVCLQVLHLHCQIWLLIILQYLALVVI